MAGQSKNDHGHTNCMMDRTKLTVLLLKDQ
uniref:Uncharacterized protein n=1 Tax=Arundo donax TaxID=35708 RepID=A0A0A9HLR7_ARUDO